MVAAWISAEIGVGPAIASPSQDCNGNWADLPQAPTSSSRPIAVTWAVEAPSTPALTDAKSTFPKVANIIMIAIESPMVGTFYSAANPDSPPFVTAGASVTPSSVVCLIEAMKVFNEIKAEKAGKIERVLVKSGEAVEFGQKLFLVRP